MLMTEMVPSGLAMYAFAPSGLKVTSVAAPCPTLMTWEISLSSSLTAATLMVTVPVLVLLAPWCRR